MERRKYSGRFIMLVGALALLAWAGYEFYVRAEMLTWFLRGLTRSVVAERRNFFHELSYYDPKMFHLTGYLLGCVIFSLVAIGLRNRPKAGYVLIVLDLALVWAGWTLGLFGLSIAAWAQSLKLLPLLAILAGCVINLVSYYARKRRRHHHHHRADWRDEADGDYPSSREMARQVRERRRSA